MGAWYNRRVADAAQLLNYLISLGCASGPGVAVTRTQIARANGWPVTRVDTLVRWIRENPQIGYGVTMRRGNPLVVVSTPHNPIDGTTLLSEAGITQDIHVSVLTQLVRMHSAEFVHWVNRDKPTLSPSERATIRRHRKRHRNMLVLIQSGLDTSISGERQLDEFIDDVLNAT